MKKIKLILHFVALILSLSFVQYSYAQSIEELFPNDDKYTVGLEERVLSAFKVQKGKSVPVLQLESKKLKDDVAYPISKLSSSNKKATNTIELYDQKKEAVFILGRLNHTDPNSGPYAEQIATAFAISADGLCVTNRHVLSELLYSSKNVDSLSKSKDGSTYFIQSVDTSVYVIQEVVAYSASNDLVIFRVNTNGKKLNYIPLADPAKVGSKVFIIAHPKQNFYYLSEGIVSKNSVLVNPANKQQMQYRMTISADYAVGSSGGPIMNERGELVGIVSSTLNINASDNPIIVQMVLKNAISVYAIQKLLKSN